MNEPSKLPINYKDFKIIISSNVEIIEGKRKAYLKVIEDLFDCQQQLFDIHWNLASMFHSIDKTQILISAYYRNIVTLLSAFELTKQGFQESARIVMRQVFEFLFIGKYTSISNDEKYLGHWLNGGHVNIEKQILSKLIIPTNENFLILWRLLCQWNHATRHSQQASLKYDEIEEELLGNLSIIIILLECNYHLLIKHYITSSALYLGKRYAKERVDSAIYIRKNVSKMLMHTLSKEGKKFIKDYRLTWTLKQK